MERTITIAELQNTGVDTWSVKDSSPRGIHTAYTSELKPGDKIVIDNYFTTLIEAQEPAAEEAAAPTLCEKMTAELEARTDRSAWNKGVTAYALELVEGLEEAAAYNHRNPATVQECKQWLLNGAQDWNQYSWGGSSLIYDCDIAARLCCPSELKKTRDGERRPNSREEWLDVQARALFQACSRVTRLFNHIAKEG
jgi:hypothetical protein